MFGSKEKKEAKKAAKEDKKESKQAAKEEHIETIKMEEEAEIATKVALKEEKDVFRQRIEENWNKSPDELVNPEFIKHSDTFFESRVREKEFGKGKALLADYFYYRSQIDIETLHKRSLKDEPSWLNIDIDSEVPLLFYDNDGMIRPQRFLVTNQNMYYSLEGGKGVSDVAKAVGKINLRQIKGTIEVKGWVHHELIINGNTLGGIDLKDGEKATKRMLEDYFQGIGMNSETFFGTSDSSQTVIQQTTDPVDQIKKLKELQDAGVITEEEFQEKKKELMDKI